MSLVPSVTELLLAEFMYLQYDDSRKPVYLYINSTGVQVIVVMKRLGRPIPVSSYDLQPLCSNRVPETPSIMLLMRLLCVSVVLQKGADKLGYEAEAFAIYDCMRFVKPPVGTVCVGSAYGEAAMLLAAGEKVRLDTHHALESHPRNCL